jgi:predicted porin
MGMDVIQLSYSKADPDADDTGATQTSVAYVRNFTKKTKAYVAYSTIANDDGVSHDSRLDSGLPVDSDTGGATKSLLGVGITHKF